MLTKKTACTCEPRVGDIVIVLIWDRREHGVTLATTRTESHTHTQWYRHGHWQLCVDTRRRMPPLSEEMRVTDTDGICSKRCAAHALASRHGCRQDVSLRHTATHRCMVYVHGHARRLRLMMVYALFRTLWRHTSHSLSLSVYGNKMTRLVYDKWNNRRWTL